MTVFRGLILCVISSFFMGCSGNTQPTQSVLKEKNQVELSRSQLQIQLGKLADELWIRTGELIFTDSHLPLTSASQDTVQKIRDSLHQQIQVANEKIQAVNFRVAQRQQNKEAMSTLVIDLMNLDWNGVQPTFLQRSNRLSIVQGESTRWNLENKEKKVISLKVTWSEKGELFIEGQAVLTVTSWIEPTPFVTSIRWFNGEVRSQGRLNLTLRPFLI
ncbi:hypothetical protein [Marinomonas algicola]|uniref:hypothetical protein n=1 Tax=Marinomonas algicola TaxID=2773454 RepID=UPI00174D92DF|nr:hypothetical protein [Marinomonas algicola]